MGCLASDPTVAALAGLSPPPDLAGQPPNDVGASLLPSFLSPSSQPEPGRDYAFSEYPQCPGEHPGHMGQTTVGGFGNYWHTDRGCQGIFRENISFFGFSIRSLAYRYTEVSATAYETNGISRWVACSHRVFTLPRRCVAVAALARYARRLGDCRRGRAVRLPAG